mmetsp:Transcript_18462/g.33575  ORF Transcript_18462/g.33575 Transcript_18462/m.33575 type:complete len:154 (+) Transcript_18462:62-523(+)
MNNNLKTSSEDLILVLKKSEQDLLQISSQLELQLLELYANQSSNPLALLKRLNKVASELPSLQADCQSLLMIKQSLIDESIQKLISNRNQIAAISKKGGESLSDDDVLASFDGAVKEWNDQILSYSSQLNISYPKLSRDDLNYAITESAFEPM